MRVAVAMIRCAFLGVHMEEDVFAEFGDVADSIENVGDEFIEQEGPLARGEGLVEAEVEHKVGERGFGHRNAVDGNPTNVGSNAGC